MFCFGRTRDESSMDAEQQSTQPEVTLPPADSKLAGYLDKRGRRLPTWRRYWFVLDGPLLLYFRSEEDYKQLSPCKGSFNLGLVVSVRPSSSAPQLALTTRSQTFHLRAPDRMEQQRWLQGLLDSIQQFSRMAAPQTANRRYEDACLPPVELSTAERVRKMGQKQFTELMPAGQVMDLSKSLRHVQKKEVKEEVAGNGRVADFTAKLPTNTPVLKMLERQRVAEKEQQTEVAETPKAVETDEVEKREQLNEEPALEKAEDKIFINGDEYTKVNKRSSDIKVVQVEQIIQKEEEKPKTEIKIEDNNEVKIKITNESENKVAKVESKEKTVEPEGEYEQIMEEAMEDDDYDQIREDYTKCSEPGKDQQLKDKNPQPQSPNTSSKETPKYEESDGDYEQIPEKDDKDEDEDYAEVSTGCSTIAHATPVVVLGADDGAEYAEAEICRSIEWEGFVGREAQHRTVISMMEPQVVVIEDDPPLPKRPHSADELDALLCGEKDEDAEGLFHAVPCRLQRAKQAAHAWAQHLPDLVIPSSNQSDEDKKENKEDKKDELDLDNGVEEEESDEEEEEEEMSLEDAMRLIKGAARRQTPRIATASEDLHQAVAVKVAPVGPFNGPLKGESVTPLSFALSDVEITIEETVNTLRSPFTSLAID